MGKSGKHTATVEITVEWYMDDGARFTGKINGDMHFSAYACCKGGGMYGGTIAWIDLWPNAEPPFAVSCKNIVEKIREDCPYKHAIKAILQAIDPDVLIDGELPEGDV